MPQTYNLIQIQGMGLWGRVYLTQDTYLITCLCYSCIAIWEMTTFPLFQQDLNFNGDIQHYNIAGVI